MALFSRLGRRQITDALDCLAACGDAAQRWHVAQTLLARQGADWITAGSAPRSALASITVASSTPEGLMRDYIAGDLYRVDPWMEHAATRTMLHEIDLEEGVRSPASADTPAPALTGLFADHGLRHVCLLPAWSGPRIGAMVLYARHPDSAQALRDPETRRWLRVLTER